VYQSLCPPPTKNSTNIQSSTDVVTAEEDATRSAEAGGATSDDLRVIQRSPKDKEDTEDDLPGEAVVADRLHLEDDRPQINKRSAEVAEQDSLLADGRSSEAGDAGDPEAAGSTEDGRLEGEGKRSTTGDWIRDLWHSFRHGIFQIIFANKKIFFYEKLAIVPYFNLSNKN